MGIINFRNYCFLCVRAAMAEKGPSRRASLMQPSMAEKPLTIAVTGASGFIGSHVVDALLARGHTVRATVRDTADTAKTAHLTGESGRYSGRRQTVRRHHRGPSFSVASAL